MTNYLQGIDVAHYQNKPDWLKVKNSGLVNYVICKATEGISKVDSKFEYNWKGIKDVGLVRGAYHFARPKNDPIVEADHFTNIVGEVTIDDLLVLDIEDNPSSMIGKPFTDWVISWLARVEENTGKIPIIYTGGPFWDLNDGIPDQKTILKLSNYTLWLSGYVKNPDPFVPKLWKNAGKTWTLWQSSGGVAASGELPLTVPGITGLVDRNLFKGNLNDLKQMIWNLHTKQPGTIGEIFNLSKD